MVLKVVVFLWILLCVFAYFIHTPTEFYLLAAFVGFVMGGIQSMSRSTYSKMLPQTEDHASYFSFYDVAEKVGIVLGTLAFGYIEDFTGSMRNSVLVLITFFVIGFILLQRVPKLKVLNPQETA
jgi:UMF1 family MFS transporter